MKPSGDDTTLPLVLLLLAGGYWYLTRGAGQGGLPRIAGAPGADGAIFEDPTAAIVKALAPSLNNAINTGVEQLVDDDSALRRGLQQLGDNATKGLGLDGGRKRSQRKRDAFKHFKATQEATVEQHAKRAWQAMSQPNVKEWWIDQAHTINIRYELEPGKTFAQVVDFQGATKEQLKDGVFRIEAPPQFWAERDAFAAEPIVRSLRRYQRRGGRIQAHFVTYAVDGFDPLNPFHPTGSDVETLARNLNIDVDTGEPLPQPSAPGINGPGSPTQPSPGGFPS